MRPVNLIPSDERRGASRGSAQSTGYAPYILLGVLAVAVLGVFLVVSAGNQVSEKEAKLESLEQEAGQAQQRATPAAAPANAVKSIAQARFDAVSATVDGRFNFERRLRQLSHVLPENVVLTQLTATEAPAATEGAAAPAPEGAAATPSGPSFKMTFCSPSRGWSTVAVVLTRMRNLDGVVKVDLGGDLSSEGGSAESGGAAAGGGEAGGACPQSNWTYDVTVSFSAGAAGAPAAGGVPVAPATATEQAQGAAGKADAANGAAGSDQSGGGSGQL